MIEVKEVDSDEVARIISLQEGHYLDFKRIEIKPAKLSETVSAFANSAGGEVFLGIAEKKSDAGSSFSWAGFLRPEDANSHIQAIA